MARTKPSFYNGLLPATLGSLLIPQMMEEVFYNKSFIEKVEKIRNKMGIPVEGLAFGRSETHYNKDSFPKLKKFEKYLKKESAELAKTYEIPPICTSFIENFILLDFDYELFEWYIPSEDIRVLDYGCALRGGKFKGSICVDIFPGCTFNTLKDFLEQFVFHFGGSDESETPKNKKGFQMDSKHMIPFKPRKLRASQKYLEILELSDKKKISSLGFWKSDEPRPECIEGIGDEQIKKIISEERRRRKIRDRHGKWISKYGRLEYK